MAFKMKGSAFYGKGNQSKVSHSTPSPTKQLAEGYEAKDGKITKTKKSQSNETSVADPKLAGKAAGQGRSKSLLQGAYDKASQVGMGVKNVIKQGPGRSTLLGDGSRQTTFNPVKAYKVGRDAEKKKDNA